MAATFSWAQSNTVSETVTDLGASGNLFNFKTNDTAVAADYSSNPITAGNSSMEVYLRAKFTDTFNKIDNLQFWQSTAFSPATGLQVTAAMDNHAFATPSTTDNGHASVPTSDPGTANVSIGGLLSGSLTGSGYSDYIVLQLDTTVAAAAGDTSLATFTLKLLGLISEKILSKFRKLRETLFETIRSETQKWGRSTTIIGTSFGMVG